MDVTTSTFGGNEGSPTKQDYVSCIKVDGIPILPPLMTEDRRQQMRFYKQKAMEKEKQLNRKKQIEVKSGIPTATPFVETHQPNQILSDPPSGEGFVTAPASPVLKNPLPPATSTPAAKRNKVNVTYRMSDAGKIEVTSIDSNYEASVPTKNDSIIASTELKTLLDSDSAHVLREQNTVRLPIESHSARTLKYFSSGARSPGEFIDCDEDMKFICPIVDDTDNQCNDQENVSSSASSTGTFIIERKATEDESTCSTAALVHESKLALERLNLKEENRIPQQLENLKPQSREVVIPTHSRQSLTTEGSTFKRKRPAKFFTDDDEKENTAVVRNDSDSTDNTKIPNCIPEDQSGYISSGDNKIKQTIIQNPPMWFPTGRGVALSRGFVSEFSQKLNIFGNSTQSLSDDNCAKMDNDVNKKESTTPGSAGKGKHVRKLSYTVETPSTHLLEAISKERNFEIVLDTVQSEPSLSRQQSVNSTPVKSIIHNSDISNSDSSPIDQVELVLKKMQQEHEQRLFQLAEHHRMQELKIKQEFESQLKSLRNKLRSKTNTSDSDKSFSESITLSSARHGENLSPPLSGRSTTVSTGLYSGRDDVMISIAASNSSSSSRLFTIPGTDPLDLATVGLSKLQNKMLQQGKGSNLFRVPAGVRSPLLKGIVFPDPLEKSVRPVRIPMKAFEPGMKTKFDRISAVVKGYLTRRLLTTERVQIIVQTIRDTVDLLLKIYEEVPETNEGLLVRPQDTELHQRLVQQLTCACQSFHDIFFKLATKEKMAIIATDREKQKAKALRRSIKPSISNATLRSIERRKTFHTSPKKKDIHRTRIRPSNAFGNNGIHTVNPKPSKLFNISPKRRRISNWDGRSFGRNTSEFGNWTTQETFVVSSSYSSNPSSSRSVRSSMSTSRSSRASISRQPWK